MTAQAGPSSGPGPSPDTPERLLSTAFRLFHEQGYHATGVATILREAGVNAGSLYHFFPSKDALLLAVLEHAKVLMHPAVMAPAEAATSDPIERVFALMDVYRQGMLITGCRMGCPIGNLALEVADDNHEARKLIDENFDNWAHHVEGWLIAAGPRLPKDIDRRRLARFVLTVMEGGLMQARAAGSVTPFDDSIAQLREHFAALQALATSTKPRTPATPKRSRPSPRRKSDS